MSERVVITGMGVLAPNAHGLADFEQALRVGRSGIRHFPELADLNFSCQVGGVPRDVDQLAANYFDPSQLRAMNTCMLYGAIAAIDCWRDAGFVVPDQDNDEVDWSCGAIIGTGISGLDTVGRCVVPRVDAGKVKRLGSTMVEQIMASAPSALIGGLLALGGPVTTNSSACTTGTEAIVNAYLAVQSGQVDRMLAGGTEGSSHYSWAAFDAMRVLARGFNDQPQAASRPMSASAAGFVPGSGAGILMLERYESAKARGARIYAEVLGGHVNCGGQRMGGSMTAPNPTGVQRCIVQAMQQAGIQPQAVDAINGHLTATMADVREVASWASALGCAPQDFPAINSTKSMIGHGLGAAGGMECVASVLQLHHQFLHGSLNCTDLHPELSQYADSVVQDTREAPIELLMKSSFGFGDVNACVVLKRWAGA